MDRSLDEIVSERHSRAPRGPRRGGRRDNRSDFPRDGVRKVHPPPSSQRPLKWFKTPQPAANCSVPTMSVRDEPRNLDSEWVHDKFDDDRAQRSSGPARRGRYSPERSTDDFESSKLRVENIHYDLTEEDLDSLFTRIGPVERLALTYDRAGRSNGVAYVTYERAQDAKRAIREFDGANANGQPIRLTLTGGGPRGRNPFDTAVRPSRPLADRITAPTGRARSYSPARRSDVSGRAPDGVDRYVPGRADRRSRSPLPRRREGRRPGARRERGERTGSGRPAPRPKKTQEELDAEMEDYWGGGNKEVEASENAANNTETVAASATIEGDIEMAE